MLKEGVVVSDEMNNCEEEDNKTPVTPLGKITGNKRFSELLPATALIVLVLVVGIAIAQPGNLPAFAGADAWNSGLFGQPDQGFDSQTYQMKDDATSDNKLQKDDAAKTEDTSVDPFLDQSSSPTNNTVTGMDNQNGTIVNVQQSGTETEVIIPSGTVSSGSNNQGTSSGAGPTDGTGASEGNGSGGNNTGDNGGSGGSAGDGSGSGGGNGVGDGGGSGGGAGDGGGSGDGGGNGDGGGAGDGGGSGDGGGNGDGGGSGDGGGDGGGAGGGDPEPPLPSIIGDPGRVEQPGNPGDTLDNTGGATGADQQTSLTVTYKSGYENLDSRNILFGAQITSSALDKFLTATVHYKKSADLDVTDHLRFGKGTWDDEISSTHTIGDDDDPVSNGQCDVRIMYKTLGVLCSDVASSASVSLKAWDNRVDLEIPTDTAGATTTNEVWFNNGYTDLSSYLAQVVNSFASPDNQGFVHTFFRGWSETAGGTQVDTHFSTTAEKGTAIPLYSLGFGAIPEGYLVRNIDGVLTLVGYTGTDATITVPAGVQAVAIETGHSNNAVTKIDLGSSAQITDFSNLADSFPNLSAYAATGSSVYTTDDKGNLYSSFDNQGNRELIRVAPSVTSLTLGHDIASLNADAFKDVAPSIHITFESDEPPVNGDVAIPDKATVSVPDSFKDIILKAYIAAWGGKGFTLDSKTPAASKYRYENGIVVSFAGDILEYVPATYRGSYSSPAAITSIEYGALSRASSLSALTLGEEVKSVGDRAFYGMTLASAMIVGDPVSIASQPGFGDFDLFAPKPYEYDPVGAPGKVTQGMSSRFMLYLPGIDSDPASATYPTYVAWLAQMEKSFGDDAAKHITCSGATLYSNPADGALYVIDDTGDYILWDVSDAATELAPLPDGKRMVAVASGAFSHAVNIKQIVLPATCTTIPSDAFDGCSALEVLFSQNTDDSSLRALFTDNGVLSKDMLISSGCTNLKLSGTHADYDHDGDYAYYGSGDESGVLVALVSDQGGIFTTRTGTHTVAPGACVGCTELQKIEMAPPTGTALTYGERAFSGCSKLGSFTQANVGAVGAEAFAGCTALPELALQGDGLVLGRAAFAGCNGLLNISITGTLDTVGESSFEGLPLLSNVVFDVTPKSALDGSITLGKRSFANCPKLNMITMGVNSESMLTFGDEMCSNCPELTMVAFPAGSSICCNSLRSIGNHAFDGCLQMRGLYWSFDAFRNLESVGDYAFFDCLKLPNITFSEATTYVGKYAYAVSSANAQLAVANSLGTTTGQNLQLATIGNYAFANRAHLTNVFLAGIGTSVTVGDGAFSGCSSLAAMTLGNAISFGEEAFSGCSLLSSLTLTHATGNELATVGKGAFRDCSSLETLSFRESTFTSVEEETFSGCSKLSSITLPATLTSLDRNVFEDCAVLQNITLLSTTMVTTESDVLGNLDALNIIVEVPRTGATDESHNLRDEYRADATWGSIFKGCLANIIDSNPVGNGQMYQDGGLYDVHTDEAGATTYTLVRFDPNYIGSAAIINGTTMIANGAFKDCSGLMTIVLPDSVEQVGQYAFSGCTSLEGLAFNPKKAPTFATDIFDNATAVNSNFRIYVPGGESANWYGSLTQLEKYHIISTGDGFALNVRAIYTYYRDSEGAQTMALSFLPRAFAGSLRVATGTDYVLDSACEGCAGLTEFFSYKSVMSIGANAFKDCTALVAADLANAPLGSSDTSTNANNMLVNIGDHAFAGCTSLVLVNAQKDKDTVGFVMPQYLTSVGNGIFEGCTSLTKCNWYAFSPIPNDTFKDCSSFTTLALGESSRNYITGYGDRAFMNCISLNPTTGGNLSTTGNLTYIGAECYKGTNLALVALPSSIERIGAGAFEGCDDLESFAFNSAKCPTFDGALLSTETWAAAHVYVPAGTKDSYLAAWQSNGLAAPAVLEDTSTYYRPIAGNIYAQPDDPSKASLQMTLVATTKAALATYAGQINLTNYGVTYDVEKGDGVLFPYSGNGNYRVRAIPANAFADNQNLRMFIGGRFLADIGDGAFKGSNLIAADLARYTTNGTNVGAVDRTDITSFSIGNEAFADCPDLAYVSLHPLTGSIGSRAFAGTSDNLWVDCARNKSTSASYVVQKVPTLGDHAFGDTLPANLRITTYPGVTAKFINGWGSKLKEDYGIDDARVNEIFYGYSSQVPAGTTHIADGAYANSASDFVLDCTLIEPSCTLGTKIFGETWNYTYRIKTESAKTDDFIKAWAPKLMEDYEIDHWDVADLFGVEEGHVAVLLGSETLVSSSISIPDGAYVGAPSDFTIDAATNADAIKKAPALGAKVFGITLPSDLRIATTSTQLPIFIAAWGAQLKDEYGIDNDRLATIFDTTVDVVVANLSTKASLQSLSNDDQPAEQSVALTPDELDATDSAVDETDADLEEVDTESVDNGSADGSTDAVSASTVTNPQESISGGASGLPESTPVPFAETREIQRPLSNEKDAL